MKSNLQRIAASSSKPLAAATERGRRTRFALIDAALELMKSGKSFNSLSIREVTKQAGIVPTAFYRHFKDMDELGLVMVDNCGRSLRDKLAEVRQARTSSKDIIRQSVLIFHKYVEAYPKYFLVASGERYGGSPLMRETIRGELGRFVNEMANDLHSLNLLPQLSLPTLRNVCELVVNTMLSAASDFLDLPKRGGQLDQRIESYIQQLRVVFLGADAWRDHSA